MDVYNGESLKANSDAFTFDFEKNQFDILGSYCPVCEEIVIEYEGDVVIDREGDM